MELGEDRSDPPAGGDDPEQTAAAKERVLARTELRDEKKRILSEPQGIARADDPARIAKRMDRLARYHLGDAAPVSTPDLSDEDADALFSHAARRVAKSTDVPAVPEETTDRDKVLERVINNADFLEIRYLDAGTIAARAVGRVVIRDKAHDLGYGTGSLVSPRLLLTNNHVLPDVATAAFSIVEFNYQDDVNRQPLATTAVGFDPDEFFLTDKARDFTLVAIKAPDVVVPFGSNPLIGAEGKAIIGEQVTIVQHPAGEKKQLVLRDQQIVDVPEDFLHYMADTKPGSSGSPVFNDQWEIVALHHASVRAPVTQEIEGGYVNEGVRISKILQAVADAPLSDAQRALARGIDVRSLEPPTPDQPAPKQPELAAKPAPDRPAPPPPPAVVGDDGWVQITVPLEIKLRLGAPLAATAAVNVQVGAPAADPATSVEKVVIDQDFAARKGFDTAFLGAGNELALPQLSPEQLAIASVVDATGTGEARHILRYHHSSIIMNARRRLPFWVAVNIDGAQHVWREGLADRADKWFFDRRIPEAEQIGEDLYDRDSPLDRGHLVRYLDPGWGPDFATAKLAADDTFHFTNCSPQHAQFNRNKARWAGVEDYILNNASKYAFKVSVFTGPVFDDTDDVYREVQLPRQFWKVAVKLDGAGRLTAAGYLLSQEQLIKGLEAAGDFDYGAYKTYQVKVRLIEGLTGLSFGALVDADALEHVEATTDIIDLESTDRIIW